MQRVLAAKLALHVHSCFAASCFQVGQSLSSCSSIEDTEDAIDVHSDSCPELAQLLQLLLQRATDPDHARKLLLGLKAALRRLDLAQGGGHTFMADVVHLYATTKVMSGLLIQLQVAWVCQHYQHCLPHVLRVGVTTIVSPCHCSTHDLHRCPG